MHRKHCEHSGLLYKCLLLFIVWVRGSHSSIRLRVLPTLWGPSLSPITYYSEISVNGTVQRSQDEDKSLLLLQEAYYYYNLICHKWKQHHLNARRQTLSQSIWGGGGGGGKNFSRGHLRVNEFNKGEFF